MTHTKEPWQVNCSHIYGPSPERDLIAQAVSDRGRCAPDRDRIVSCVNALAGIPDPAAFVQAARGMAEALRAEVERLREALQEFVDGAGMTDDADVLLIDARTYETALAELRRGKELAERPTLTREMVREAVEIAFSPPDRWPVGYIDAMHAALVERLKNI